ncbi:MAG TPA: PEP-CTERM-box response regulator transcription factor [Candidatus Sulfotelmatobacter sp.]|nr:PEP-CTERM-box response regulator transcription factor [Candidatus Sulfotelmatobacter sp.]
MDMAEQSKPKVLNVEDEEAIRKQLWWALNKEYDVLTAETADEAAEIYRRERPSAVTLDLGLPPQPSGSDEGLRALTQILGADPLAKVIVLTGNGDRAMARRAVELGACDYYLKPVQVEDLRIMLRRAIHLRTLEEEVAALRRQQTEATRYVEILGNSPRMQEVFATIERVADTTATVLITGESGTGKELVARAIHEKSGRRSRPFVPLNCGAIPESLLESELFGHEKGAFTGAHQQRKGRLELAEGGTVFLDEVSEMAPALQVKLLRFLQERVIERVGGREAIPVDVRVLAASNVDLQAAIAQGTFREDLYFRLGVVAIAVPPLRARGDDILFLANVFLQRHAAENRRQRVRGFGSGATQALVTYRWPGNVRELENRVRRAAIMAQGTFVEPADLGFGEEPVPEDLSLRAARQRLERHLLLEALKRHGANISHAAKELGVSRPFMHDLIRKYRISVPDLKGQGEAAGA